MKIVKILNDDCFSIEAIIKVEPNEIADIEEMVALIDDDEFFGNCGVEARLVSIEKEPEIIYNDFLVSIPIKQEFLPNISKIKDKDRYYWVCVYREDFEKFKKEV